MTATASPARDRLERWLRRNDRRLAQRAISDVSETDALREAVSQGDRSAVDRSQIRALLNTAQMSEAHTLRKDHVRKRATRRRKAGQDDAADFWEATDERLGDLIDEVATEAIEACGAPDVTSESLRDETFDVRTVRTLVTRAYVKHFVAHCALLRGKNM